MLRYLVAGAVNTAATYALYYALLYILPYATAYTIAFGAGIVLAYLLNARYVFAVPVRVASALAWPMVYVAQYLMGLAVLALMVERLGVAPPLAAILAVLVTIPLTFVLSRRVLGRSPR